MIKFIVKDLIPMNLNWWKPTRQEWVPVLMDDHIPFWRREVDPTTNRPWARLTPSYAKWKSVTHPGNPILKLSGTMLAASYITERGQKFTVNSTRYGAYNQFGTSRMAARPWMGVPDISLMKLSSISWKHILSRKR